MKDFLGNPITHDVLGRPIKTKKKTTKKKTTKKVSSTKRGTLYAYDKEIILKRQKNLCAGKNCAKNHNGKKVAVNLRNNFDHRKPLKLGGKDNISNIQALCANCHQEKTRKDRKDIAEAKKSGKISSSNKTARKKSAKRKSSKKKIDNPFEIKPIRMRF